MKRYFSRKSGINTSLKAEIACLKTAEIVTPTPRVQYNKVFEMAKHLEKPLFVCVYVPSRVL